MKGIKALMIFLSVLAVFLPLNAYAAKRIVFLIPATSAKVVSDGIVKFRQEYSRMKEKIDIVVCSDEEIEKNKGSLNLADADIIFLYHLGYKGMMDLEKEVKAAKASGTRVIGIGVYDAFKDYFNVDLRHYPNIEKYWEYNGAENAKRLIAYMLSSFFNLPEMLFEPPFEQPLQGIYHPDAPGQAVFDSFEKYLKWYKSSGHFQKNAPFVGLLAYNTLKTDDNEIEKAVIREIEKNKLNVLCAIGYPPEEILEKYLMKNGKPYMDVLISLMFSHAKEEATRMLIKANIPVIRGISLYSELSEWRKSPQGVMPSQLASQIFLPELSGLIEPIVLGGRQIGFDKRTGIKITQRVPEKERIRKVVARARAWAKLKGLANNEKKIAVIYYNHATGKQNISASYLNVFNSLEQLFKQLSKTGYSLGKKPAITKEELQDMILMCGRNISTSAPGELQKMVGTGKLTLIPVEKYKKWFEELPEAFKKQVNKKWGSVDETTLMTWKDKKGKKFIVIPGLVYGNVFVGPQPSRGWLAEGERLYHDVTLPPHHQYIAFYLWLKKEFKVDALIHFGKHGTLEWTPGKQVGLSEVCNPDVLIADIPDVYPYLMDDVGEGVQAKRRGCGVIIDHMIPAIKMSGLYKEYIKINELIPLYLESKDQTPQLAVKYKEEILKLSKELGIGKDLGLDLDTVSFEHYLDKLHDYMYELRAQSMPYGLHILGVSLEGDALVSMVRSMLNVESDIPAISRIVADMMGMDYKEIEKHPGRHGKEVEKIDEICMQIVNRVVLEDINAKEAGKLLGNGRYRDAASSLKASFDTMIVMAKEYARNLSQCDNELKGISRALDAGYILPGPGNDPIRCPDALPTGRNFYSFDPEKIPTMASWEVGKKLASDLIKNYKKENGRYPHKAAIILWCTETLRHHGVMESKALYLLGVRLVWDGRGKVKGVELIPEKELKRPRIDIVVNPSGLYRDVFPIQVGLIDDAVQLAINAEKEKYENFVRLHTLEMEKVLKKKGYSVKEAKEFSRFRIFGAPNQGYGTGLDQAIPASGSWEKDDKLTDLYISRMSYAYGRNVWGKQAKDAYKETVKGTDLIVHSRSTNLFGVLDNDDFYQYMGGLAMTVRNLSGKTPQLYVVDDSNPSSPKMVNFSKFMGLEMRARYFNPKWITGMKEHGYSGAKEMTDFVEYLWGWQVTTPKNVTKEMWQQTFEVYVEDKYGMELKKFFDKNSPHAYQSIAARMLEVERKGYQKFDKKFLERVAKDYIKSVAENGMACSANTCDNIALNQFAANMVRAKGLVSAGKMVKFKQQVKTSTGLDVKMPEWVKETETKKKETAASGVKQTEKKMEKEATAGGVKQAEKKMEKEADVEKLKELEKVKGYKMEEEKQGETAQLSPVKVIISAIMIVLLVVGIIGIGWWRGMRKEGGLND